MPSYTRNELMSSSEIVRNFSSVLNSIKRKETDRIVIMRKNRLEAVILPIDEYERIQKIMDYFERFQLYKTLKQRDKTPLKEYIDFDQILADNGLNYDEI